MISWGDFKCILKTEISEANEQAEEDCYEEDLADDHNSVSIPHGEVGVPVHCQCAVHRCPIKLNVF